MKVKITKSIDYTTPFSAAENDKDLEKITRLKYSKACSNLRTDAGFFARTIEGIKEHQTWRLIGYNTFEDFCKNELGRAIDEVEAIVIGVKALGGVATEAEAKQAAVWKLAADDHQNGMTQQEAAKKHGVTQQAVSKAKRNTTKNSQGEQKVVIPEWLKGSRAKAKQGNSRAYSQYSQLKRNAPS